VYICDTPAVERGLCLQEHFGEFLVANSSSPGSIFTKAVNLAEPRSWKYYVKDTNYYCVATIGMGDEVKYNAIVEWRNAFGELNAAEYPKLPFYGALTIVYALVGALWGFLYYQHRTDILPIQVLFSPSGLTIELYHGDNCFHDHRDGVYLVLLRLHQ
jgi:hypothetical protein